LKTRFTLAAGETTVTTLRFFFHRSKATSPDATGCKGFYYHFLDMKSGRRAIRTFHHRRHFLSLWPVCRWHRATFPDSQNGEERESRDLAKRSYARRLAMGNVMVATPYARLKPDAVFCVTAPKVDEAS